MKRVYVCHPYVGGEGPKANLKHVKKRVGEIVKELRGKKEEFPLLFVPHFAFSDVAVDHEGKELRDWAMAMCLEMVRWCDELWVYPLANGDVSMGMRQEINMAERHSIKVIWRNK